MSSRAKAYAKMHGEFLKANFPKVHAALQKSGQLPSYLQQLGSQADEMQGQIESQMMTSPNLPKDYGQRVKALEAIPHQAQEMVLNDLVHNPPSQDPREPNQQQLDEPTPASANR
jgi:hypothetical protein